MRRGCHLKYSIHDKEVGSILLRHKIKKKKKKKKKYPDLASIRFQVDSSARHFHSGERSQKVADMYAGLIRRIRVDGSRTRKGKVADSKISGRGLSNASLNHKVFIKFIFD